MRIPFAGILALAFSSSALGASGRIGLYPLVLPDGQEQLGDRLAAQLHEGAAALPGVKAFDLVAHSACGVDETECLALAARHAGLDAMVSAAVTAQESGYRFQLRQVAADGTLVNQSRGEVRGGPLDLAGALEHGVCELLAAGACEGEIVASSSAPGAVHLFVDGVDRGAMPVTVRIPIGRHAVRAGDAERRVRVSYGRVVRLDAELRGGSMALLDGAPAVPQEAVAAQSSPADPARASAGRVLLGASLALFATAGGIALYTSRAAPGTHDTANIAATALVATGAGALLGSGLLFALSPSGAALQGSF